MRTHLGDLTNVVSVRLDGPSESRPSSPHRPVPAQSGPSTQRLVASPTRAAAPEEIPEDSEHRFCLARAAFRQHDYARAAALLLTLVSASGTHRGPASRYLAQLYAHGYGGLPKDKVAARYWRSVSGVSHWRRLADSLAGPWH